MSRISSASVFSGKHSKITSGVPAARQRQPLRDRGGQDAFALADLTDVINGGEQLSGKLNDDPARVVKSISGILCSPHSSVFYDAEVATSGAKSWPSRVP
jgi:hypothetical protein